MADPWAEFKQVSEPDPWAEFQKPASAPAAPILAPKTGTSRLAALRAGVGMGATLGAAPKLAAYSTPDWEAPNPELGGASLRELGAKEYTPQQARARAKQLVSEAKGAHPWIYYPAEIAASLPYYAAMPGPTAARSSPLAWQMAAGAGRGGVAGLASGIASGETPLDVALQTGTGVIAGGGAPAVVEAAKQGARATAVGLGRHLLQGHGGLSLQRPLTDAEVLAALREKAILPFASIKSGAERLAKVRSRLGRQEQGVLEAMEKKGITGPRAGDVATEFMGEGERLGAQTVGSPRPGYYIGAAEELVPGIGQARAYGATPEQIRLLRPGKPVGPENRLGLVQAEEMKREAQNIAAKEFDRISGQRSVLGETKIDMARRLRENVEREIAAQAEKAPEEAARFVPLKRHLGNIMGASDAAEVAAARAARRRWLSPYMAMAGVGGAIAGHQTGGLGNALAYGIAAPLVVRTMESRVPSALTWGGYNLAELLGSEGGSELTKAALLAAALRRREE